MSIYVLTAHEFNHNPQFGKLPLDSRFINSDRNYIYYLIDNKVPPILKTKSVLLEREIDSQLADAGRDHFGEWSFLLAEAKHSFCSYPFFMISSRFYQKNQWLLTDLNTEWDRLFLLLKKYGWGYLPSYDRPLRWIDLEWKSKIRKASWNYTFFPFTEDTFRLVQDIYGVKIPEEYRAFSDLFCNYIGFQSREHLLQYVNFYMPLIHSVFNENHQPKIDISKYARKTGEFRNEKPFTFVLEWFSHLFFYKEMNKCFALHYDGYHEIDERNQKFKMIHNFKIPLKLKIDRFCSWQWKKAKTEGCLAPIAPTVRMVKKILRNW